MQSLYSSFCDSDQVSWWSSGITLAHIARDKGLRHRIFLDCVNLFDPLLHLVANEISNFEMHEDILSPLEG